MAFEKLTERLQGVFKNLRRRAKNLSEKEVQEVTKEIRLALRKQTAHTSRLRHLSKRVRERAVRSEIIDTLMLQPKLSRLLMKN